MAHARVRPGRRARALRLAAPVLLIAAAALAWAAPVASADEPVSQFSIAEGRAWVRSAVVTVGDGGVTPFFTPGVIAWDGGSVMGSFGIDPHKMFAQQTQALLDRPAALWVSATPGADVADMIAEAPTEIDVHLDPTADANLCVVQGGASDLKVEWSVVGEVFEALKTYCRDRRAAGFQVAVLTLLPRSDIASFNARRNSFNTLVRQQWPGFADALVDVAADPRMGDDGDNLDVTYYRRDQVHPNALGCAVLAQDTAPVLDALRWQADSLTWRLRNSEGRWTPWAPYTYSSPWQLGPGDGRKAVLAEYRTGGGETVPVTDDVNLDTARPAVTAFGARRVRRGDVVSLGLRVDDSPPCASSAEVTIELLRGHRVVRSVTQKGLRVNRRHLLTFGWRLRAGVYSWRVRARDGAGNPQVAPARRTLRVE
jgi:lysophospholipase L1-like esterase